MSKSFFKTLCSAWIFSILLSILLFPWKLFTDEKESESFFVNFTNVQEIGCLFYIFKPYFKAIGKLKSLKMNQKKRIDKIKFYIKEQFIKFRK